MAHHLWLWAFFSSCSMETRFAKQVDEHRACLVAGRCAPCHTCGRHQELDRFLPTWATPKTVAATACLVPVKVVAATATFYVKPHHSCGVKIHRLRFGAAIVAEWRATAKKKKLRRRHTCSGRLWQPTKQPHTLFPKERIHISVSGNTEIV
jgi:hypothetical protein